MKYNFWLLLLLLLADCSKHDNNTNVNLSANKRPAAITIDTYFGITHVQKSIYTPLYSASGAIVSVDVIDTSYQLPVDYANTIYHTTITPVFDPGTGLLSRVISQCKQAVRVYIASPTYTFTEGAPLYGADFRADFVVKYNSDSTYYTEASITSFSDSAQMDAVQKVNWSTFSFVLHNAYQYQVTTQSDEEYYEQTKDSIYYEANPHGASFYTPGRNADFYLSTLPAYRPDERDRMMYSLKSDSLPAIHTAKWSFYFYTWPQLYFFNCLDTGIGQKGHVQL